MLNSTRGHGQLWQWFAKLAGDAIDKQPRSVVVSIGCMHVDDAANIYATCCAGQKPCTGTNAAHFQGWHVDLNVNGHCTCICRECATDPNKTMVASPNILRMYVGMLVYLTSFDKFINEIKGLKVAEEAGVEPTKSRLATLSGFEVRNAHRDIFPS